MARPRSLLYGSFQDLLRAWGRIRKQGHDVAGRGRCTLSGNSQPSNGRSPIGGGEAVVRVRVCDLDQRAPLGAVTSTGGPAMVPRPGAAWLAACLPGNPRVIRGFRPVFSIRQHAPNGLEATVEIQPRVPDTPTNARHRVQDTLGSTRTHRGSGTRSMCQVRRDGRDPDILTVTSTRARHSDSASRTKGIMVPRVVESPREGVGRRFLSVDNPQPTRADE